jgi:hypothetical protein
VLGRGHPTLALRLSSRLSSSHAPTLRRVRTARHGFFGLPRLEVELFRCVWRRRRMVASTRSNEGLLLFTDRDRLADLYISYRPCPTLLLSCHVYDHVMRMTTTDREGVVLQSYACTRRNRNPDLVKPTVFI